MSDVFLCDGIRTPVGRYAGGLAPVRTDDLAAIVDAAGKIEDQRIGKAVVEHFRNAIAVPANRGRCRVIQVTIPRDFTPVVEGEEPSRLQQAAGREPGPK